jgi:subfamily B ATP-binding cassette protein MsbA
VTQEALAAAERILSLLDIPKLINDAPDASELTIGKGDKSDISFAKVGFTYGKETALGDVSFKASAGQIVALVGPSGAGKTTIINLLPRFYDVTAGMISVNGQDIRNLTIESLRAHIALVIQEAILFEDTVAANIGFGRRDATDEDIIAAAKDAAAHDFIMALPNGYQTQVGAMGNRLSGGQRQRISIARAMLKDAPILLLDEATAALDAESEKQVQTALERLQKGRTTLVVAHRLATVRNADMILVMEDGGITETGTHDDLIAKDGLYARLCALQFFSDK